MLRRLLHEERGQGLTELLVAMVIGGLVLGGVLLVFTTTIRADARTEDRVSSTARARLAVEATMTALNSQVCKDALTAPVLVGSTASTLTYYADSLTSSSTGIPAADNAHVERLSYSASKQTIVRQVWTGQDPTQTPASTRTIAQGVTSQDAAGPFTYFGYTPTSSGPPLPDQAQVAATSAGLTATQVAVVVRVHVALVAQVTRTRDDRDARSTVLSGDAYVQSLDPLQPQLGARCAA